MTQPPSKITPKGFKKFVTRAGGKSWIPDTTKKYLRGTGESRYFSYSATKRQAISALRGLQSSGLAKPRLKPELFYRDMTKGEGTGTGLAISKLPANLPKEKFLSYLEQATNPGVASRAKSLMEQWAMSGRGDDQRLSQQQMGSLLRHLDIHTPSIGEAILKQERLREANVRGFIEEEVGEEERRLGLDPRTDRLPEGVVRSAGRPAAASALRSALQKREKPETPAPSLKNPLRPAPNLNLHTRDQTPGAAPNPTPSHPTLDLAV